MKTRVAVRRHRRILCIFPRYAPSFGTFHHAYPLMDGVRAFMPPQGILVVAAYLPQAWEVRLVDENVQPASAQELGWADAVFVSGMHVQKSEIKALAQRARALGKTTVLGGSSVSASPEQYPEFDYLHIGEVGDATDRLIEALDQDATPPPAQRRFVTETRLPLADFPTPAYELIDGRRYFIGSVQFSSGCPYRCEFCDIPALYGRQPRLKSPEQVIGELDALIARRDQDLDLFRRRQFYREQEGGPRFAAASRRLAEASRLSGAAVLRGDPQHCQIPGNIDADAGSLLLHDLLRHRDPGARRARGHAEIA